MPKSREALSPWIERPLSPKRNPPLGYTLTVDASDPYMRARGLDRATIVEFGLGYCDSGPLRKRIAIPVQDAEGRLVGYAGRRPSDLATNRSKYKFVTAGYLGSELFNLHRAQQERAPWPVILVTGFFDVMHLWQLGLRRVVALMDCEFKTSQLALLLYYFPTDRFVALFDETEYGRAARESVTSLLVPHAFVRVMQFHDEGRRVESLTAAELEGL